MRRPYNDKDKQIGRGSKSLSSGSGSSEDGGGELGASRAEGTGGENSEQEVKIVDKHGHQGEN